MKINLNRNPLKLVCYSIKLLLVGDLNNYSQMIFFYYFECLECVICAEWGIY